MADGLQDLTGGIPSSVDLDEAGREPGMLWKLLVSNHKAGYMMGAGTPQGSDRDVIQGIAQGHAYSILDVRDVQGERLLQLRNPWGRTEWQGKYGSAWMRRSASSKLKRLFTHSFLSCY